MSEPLPDWQTRPRQHEDGLMPTVRALGHRYFVIGMKVALPLTAAALFLTVLVYSGVFDSRDKLSINFREVSSVNNDLRMVSPRVDGLDKSGRPYLMTADTAIQASDNPNLMNLDNVQADLKMSNQGDWVSLNAVSGLLNTETEFLQLHQKIDIYASSGYEFHGTSADVNLREGTLASSEPVHGHGPLGTLRADSMTANNKTGVIVFTGNVKMVINNGNR